MEEVVINLIYDTLADLTSDPYRLPGIENAFAPGSECDALYAQAYKSGRRICMRLGVESDPDLELIFHNLEEISRILGCKMFLYGEKSNNPSPRKGIAE